MTALRPFGSLREVFAAAESVWWKLAPAAWLDAFAAHPRIGGKRKGKEQTAKSASWSKDEQQRVDGAAKAVRAQLEKKNDEYFKKFGFIFIVFASGKSAEEMLALLEERLPRSKKAELETAAVEQMKITRLRLEKYFTTELER
jgi:OHCU decarboxylase